MTLRIINPIQIHIGSSRANSWYAVAEKRSGDLNIVVTEKVQVGYVISILMKKASRDPSDKDLSVRMNMEYCGEMSSLIIDDNKTGCLCT